MKVSINMTNRFPLEIHSKLKYYIYIYIDPRDNQIFYVGKGKCDRVFAHLSEESEKDKVKRIREIQSEGLQPKIEIVIHGIDNGVDAQRIEASIIDCFGIDNLTNIQRGYHSKEFGRMSIEQIIATYQSEPVNVTHDVVAFKINQTFRYGLSPVELYDITRHSWVMSTRREKARYAIAVYQGVVQEVYEIEAWLPQNSTLNTKHLNGEINTGKNTERWEFVGNIASENIRQLYRYKNVSHYLRSSQRPFEYINCKTEQVTHP